MLHLLPGEERGSALLSHPNDLLFTRNVNACPERIWAAWTVPELFVRWFAPRPFSIEQAKIEPVPGGEYSFIMVSPSGHRYAERPGCVLVAEFGKRFIWTDALGPMFRPNSEVFITVDLSMRPSPAGTLCRIQVRHKNENDCKFHLQMGFEKNWQVALNQLELVMGDVGTMEMV